jgi:hypothetical protein
MQHNSMKRAHGMAQLNFLTIGLPHETCDKMQKKQQQHDKATTKCNDHGANYQQSTTSEDDTNNKDKDNDNDCVKHKHRGVDEKTTPCLTTSNNFQSQRTMRIL